MGICQGRMASTLRTIFISRSRVPISCSVVFRGGGGVQVAFLTLGHHLAQPHWSSAGHGVTL